MEPKLFRHASLFTGIGGFDLAASWMGWQNVFQCETEPFCQKVLKHHFPQCELFEDIRTSDFSKYHGTIEIITGGFPCQPFSVAGKRKGTDDDRFLWAEMYRALREVQPRWVVAENVCGLLTLQSGVVFERVCADLENAGYAVQPFIIPACAVGAPHRRDRIWIIANADRYDAEGYRYGQAGCANGTNQSKRTVAGNRTVVNTGNKGIVAHASVERLERYIACGKQTDERKRDESRNNAAGSGKKQSAAHSEGERFQERDAEQVPYKPHTAIERYNSVSCWDNFPTQSPVCNRNDGISGMLADLTFSKWRSESIKALGNAIVPQIAYQIFKAIEITES